MKETQTSVVICIAAVFLLGIGTLCLLLYKKRKKEKGKLDFFERSISCNNVMHAICIFDI